MDEMEQKLGAVLKNPELMQKIMSMAQSLGNPPSLPRNLPRLPKRILLCFSGCQDLPARAVLMLSSGRSLQP